MQGRILVASHDGVYLIVFEGDVRLTLCTTVDGYLDKMFSDESFRSVVVDQSRTENMDSTSLGLLAKLSIQAEQRFNFRPTLVSTRPDNTRILLSMGFDEVFNLVETPLEHEEQLVELPCVVESDEDVRARVLEAHRTLMAMNDSNREAFQDLVAMLESDLTPPRRAAG
jgi:anti-anti-sigma factor